MKKKIPLLIYLLSTTSNLTQGSSDQNTHHLGDPYERKTSSVRIHLVPNKSRQLKYLLSDPLASQKSNKTQTESTQHNNNTTLDQKNFLRKIHAETIEKAYQLEIEKFREEVEKLKEEADVNWDHPE